MHAGHRNRVKERFLKEGLSSFADHEVLELLLFYAIPQGDTNPIAHRLLSEFSSLSAVFNAPVEELCKVDGIKEHSATLIKLIPQISQFYSSLQVREKKQILTSQDAGTYVCGMIGCKKSEVFAVICLDSQRNILAFEILEEGTVSEANVHPRKVVEYALRQNAAAVILAHNHPSGGAYASENDRRLTTQLCTLFEGMGISVIDHIISASSEKFISMADSGLMPN
ncbi:MAG: DNA repair protein RadC [Clostridia bacterium]|nr:DNA repair protein RadC [Clostridia bacterium]